MILLSEAAQIEDFLFRELQPHFKKKEVNVRERIRPIPDLYKYRQEDPYIRAQGLGKIPQHYSLYFDGEFVCDFDSTYPPEAILVKFWRGLLPLYNERKIYFDQTFYKVEAEIVKHEAKRAKEARKAKIKQINASPEVKAIINQIENETTP